MDRQIDRIESVLGFPYVWIKIVFKTEAKFRLIYGSTHSHAPATTMPFIGAINSA